MMIATLILATNDHFVLPFSAIDTLSSITLIIKGSIFFLMISAYFPDHFAVKKVPLNLQIETSCGNFETS
jgi:type III secretory pathway component EscV